MSFLKEPKIFMREKCEVSSSILLTYQQRVLLPVVLGELGQKPKTRFDCFKMKFSIYSWPNSFSVDSHFML